jgi:hypothetical protein
VDEEWRVNLIVHGPPTIRKPVSANAVRDLLRSRVGEEVSVTAGKAGVFLYAATADAAETAERRAREVLAEQGLVEDIRLERWEPSRQAWVDVRAEAPGDAVVPELPSGQERNPGRRRLRSAGAVVAGIIDAIGNTGIGQ